MTWLHYNYCYITFGKWHFLNGHTHLRLKFPISFYTTKILQNLVSDFDSTIHFPCFIVCSYYQITRKIMIR